MLSQRINKKETPRNNWDGTMPKEPSRWRKDCAYFYYNWTTFSCQFSTVSSLQTTQSFVNYKGGAAVGIAAEGDRHRWMVTEVSGGLGKAQALKTEVSEGRGKAAQGSPSHACPRRHRDLAGPGRCRAGHAHWAAAAGPPSFPQSDRASPSRPLCPPPRERQGRQGESGRARSLSSRPAGTRGLTRPSRPPRRGNCPCPLAAGKLLAGLTWALRDSAMSCAPLTASPSAPLPEAIPAPRSPGPGSSRPPGKRTEQDPRPKVGCSWLTRRPANETAEGAGPRAADVHLWPRRQAARGRGRRLGKPPIG